MKCIVCNSTTTEFFFVNQRLRGKVEWLRCLGCKAYFTRKGNKKEEIDILTQNPWGKKEEGIKLSEAKKLMFTDIYNLLTKKTNKQELKVLDIGSSFGGFAKLMKEMKHDVHSYDIIDDPVEYLKSLGIKAVVSNSVMQYSELTNEKNFDVIAAIDCICYWENIHAELTKIHDILKPGGYFVVRNPDKSWMLSLGRFLKSQKIKSKCVHDHTNVVPLNTMKRKLKELGFTIVLLSFTNALPNNQTKFLTRMMYYLGGMFYRLTGFHFSPGYVMIAIKLS